MLDVGQLQGTLQSLTAVVEISPSWCTEASQTTEG